MDGLLIDTLDEELFDFIDSLLGLLVTFGYSQDLELFDDLELLDDSLELLAFAFLEGLASSVCTTSDFDFTLLLSPSSFREAL